MLMKSDLKQIKGLMQASLQEFFETLILPYFEHNEQDHKEIREILKKHDQRFDENDRDNEKMIKKLQQNQEEHDEMFQRLDRIEAGVTDHGKRIKRLETAVVS